MVRGYHVHKYIWTQLQDLLLCGVIPDLGGGYSVGVVFEMVCLFLKKKYVVIDE